MPTEQQVLAALSGYPKTLNWNNFRSVPQSPNPPFTAQTSSSFRVTYGAPTLHRDKYYRLSAVRGTVTLNGQQTWKALNWFNQASAKDKLELLEHEQGHFDITGLICRDLVYELMSLEMNDEIVAVLQGVGNSAQARLQHARTKMLADAQRKTQEATQLQQWLENAVIGGQIREGQYERDTNHGNNRLAQQKWTRIFQHGRNHFTSLSLLMSMHNCSSGMATTLGTCVANTP